MLEIQLDRAPVLASWCLLEDVIVWVVVTEIVAPFSPHPAHPHIYIPVVGGGGVYFTLLTLNFVMMLLWSMECERCVMSIL